MLAKEEALACLSNVRFINVYLHKQFPERTLEAIKGQRKQGIRRYLKSAKRHKEGALRYPSQEDLLGYPTTPSG